MGSWIFEVVGGVPAAHFAGKLRVLSEKLCALSEKLFALSEKLCALS
jgi:hypothetical protein